jgi:hypothetical protein
VKRIMQWHDADICGGKAMTDIIERNQSVLG